MYFCHWSFPHCGWFSMRPFETYMTAFVQSSIDIVNTNKTRRRISDVTRCVSFWSTHARCSAWFKNFYSNILKKMSICSEKSKIFFLSCMGDHFLCRWFLSERHIDYKHLWPAYFSSYCNKGPHLLQEVLKQDLCSRTLLLQKFQNPCSCN